MVAGGAGGLAAGAWRGVGDGGAWGVDEVFPEGLNRICMCVCIAMGTVAIPYLAESAAVSSCPKPERSTALHVVWYV